MAILKHFSMKSGNYSGAINYLTYEHDEFTQKVVNDEYGHPVLRDGIIFDGINCEPYSYDYDCVRTNNHFHKNQGFNDVKQHHYVISFDPKDVTECNLTAERAQEIGMDYARRNFPGHQTLVCTHLDGHKHSGNIHVHIVFNSLRKLDVDRREFMERPCDNKAGYKYHETKKMMVYLKKDLMETCKKHNLHQVDLLSPAKNRVTDREYYAKEHMEMQAEEKAVSDKAVPFSPEAPDKIAPFALDADKNNSDAARKGAVPKNDNGSPSRTPQTKAETHKDYLRNAIKDAANTATSDKEFASVLMEKYDVALKVSRGRFSYLHPERTKPIRGRMLGADYEETALREVFRKNALDSYKGHIDNTVQQADTAPADPGLDHNTLSTDNIINGTFGTNIISVPLAGTHSRDNITLLHVTDNDLPEESAPDSPEASQEYEAPHLTGQWKDEYGFVHHAKIPMPKELAKPSDIPFVRSMQDAVVDSINNGYTYHSEEALLNDLRELSQSVCYVQEKGYASVEAIENAYMGQLSSLNKSYHGLADVQDRIDLINEKIHFVGVYRSTADVYKQYRVLPAKAKAAFRDKHYKALNAHDQAYSFLSSHGHPDKLPSIQALKAYKNEQLIPARDMYKRNYVVAKAELNEISKVRENLYPLLNNTHSRSIERGISRNDAR